MIMLDSDKFRAEISADLGLDRPRIKGQTVSVNNCWHFYTAGESVDAMFYDNDDFRNGMNRVYSTALKYDILILAFVLMDTHVHFVLYGGFGECNAFLHCTKNVCTGVAYKVYSGKFGTHILVGQHSLGTVTERKYKQTVASYRGSGGEFVHLRITHIESHVLVGP